MGKAGQGIATAVLLAAIGAPAVAQSTRPTLAPAVVATPAAPASVAGFVQAIREANSLAAAAHAYAGGCGIDRKSGELNAAYLRKLLQLGQVQFANVPALVLIGLDADDALANAALGCYSGRKGEYGPALFHTMKAAGAIPDDPSVQNNLGQLVAWVEGAKAVRLAPELGQDLAALKERLGGKPAYQGGYKPLKEAYDQQAAAITRNQQAAAAMESDAQDLRKKAADAQARLKPIEDEIAVHQRTLDSLKGPDPRMPGLVGDPKAVGTFMFREQQAIDDAQRRAAPIRQELQNALRALADKTAAQNGILNRTVDVPLKKLFRWLPPAVDGVVTLPLDTPPLPKPASAPAGAK
jgi:hypothetical protein